MREDELNKKPFPAAVRLTVKGIPYQALEHSRRWV